MIPLLGVRFYMPRVYRRNPARLAEPDRPENGDHAPATRTVEFNDAPHLCPDPRGRPDQWLRVRHPEHRRGGAKSGSGRPEGPLPQHRRPDHLRIQDAAAPDRGGRAGHARRPQRLRAVGRHSRRPREAVAERVRAARHADVARSRRHHLGHLGRDRAGADGAGRGRATRC